MFAGIKAHKHQTNSSNYIYPQFLIDEKSGRIEVCFIDRDSGRIVRYIPSTELNKIIQGYFKNWSL